MQLDKKTIRTLLLMAGFCIVLYWALQNLDRVSGILGGVWGLVSPFVLGGSLAFILNVPMRAIEKKLPKRMTRFRRAAALTLTLLAVVGVLALVLLLIIPQLGRTIASIGARLPAFWAESQKWLAEIMERYPVLEEWISSKFITDWESAIAAAVDWFKNGGFALVGNAATAATGLRPPPPPPEKPPPLPEPEEYDNEMEVFIALLKFVEKLLWYMKYMYAELFNASISSIFG